MLQLIQVLMGSEPSEKDKEIYPAYRQFGRRKVFSTLSAGVASVGLAAAANGADVSVECISRNNDREVTVFLPRDGHPSRQSTFVIRLWLCTPPFSFYVRPREYDGAENELRDDYATLIIYGGDREIALSAARELDFWDAQAFDHGKHERDVVALWQDGVAAGLDLKWRVKSPQPKQKDSGLAVNTSPKLRLQLEHPPRETIKGGYVDQLASVLTRHRKGLEPIARRVAAIIDNVYGYLNYVEGKDAELFSAATQFVLIALAVGTLKSLTRLPGNDFSYALNLGSLTIRGEFAAQLGTGELLRLPESALGQGVMPSELLWCCSLLWGGASNSSQGFRRVNEQVIGVVAPQCTVVLDFICNPFTFIREGLHKPIMSIHFGSVPLLPREPQSGFVTATKDSLRARGGCASIDCLHTSHNPEDPTGDLVLSLEAGIATASGPTECAWVCYYQGDVAFELDPAHVFGNLLYNRHDEVSVTSSSEPTAENQDQCFRYIDFHDLIEIQSFDCENGVAVFRAGRKLGWVAACAGSAPFGSVILQNHDERPEHARPGDVVIVMR